MFKLVDKRYAVDGRKVRIAREKKGLNLSEFAYICGWSPGYQWQIEDGCHRTISESTKNVIESSLK